MRWDEFSVDSMLALLRLFVLPVATHDFSARFISLRSSTRCSLRLLLMLQFVIWNLIAVGDICCVELALLFAVFLSLSLTSLHLHELVHLFFCICLSVFVDLIEGGLLGDP